ncbi:OsmC family protein [Streptomyces sp. NPDC053560]|uniref:OsmC family protein n=1 Tax=Streptomyces sp. NPDC053560 TaxID=3365711 RepID=UPI0037D1994E
MNQPGRISVSYAGGEFCTGAVRGHTAAVDQPSETGGEDFGPTPVELFVAYLAACVAYYAGRFLQRHRLSREALLVDTRFEMAEDRPPRVARMEILVITPAGLSSARREELSAVVKVKRCTVHNSPRLPPEVDIGIR